MFVLALASALGVVDARYASRRLFLEQERLRNEKEQLQVEWWRLQLEQSTWAAHSRIEQVAHEKLKMRMLEPKEVIVIRH
ncbi:MAG: cell division protein FtsL [Gammaproteobacteria bacterium]|nr:cell division protein FtsL [Gammaproteobacteria bacterium]MBU1654202.1 cell division protein FtsL [Gammaproteobacteria bacterium]MBU1960862.1 cell division protein FtsL [Gammaproteobacteria bacterium]